MLRHSAIYNYRKGNYIDMSQHLNSKNCSSEMILIITGLFFIEILKVVKQFVPETQDCRNESKPHWWRKHLTKATKLKGQLFRHYLNSKSNDDYSRYVVQRNLTKSLIRQAQRNFEESLFQNIRSDPKSFYKYIRSKQKVKSTVYRIERPDGTPANGDEKTAK